VNLGSDSDTTGAVTGALGGLLYGYNSIPKEWIDELARKDYTKRLIKPLKIG
jgi:ADP-ribosyl-[dinitrogen reductase] hydrolase